MLDGMSQAPKTSRLTLVCAAILVVIAVGALIPAISPTDGPGRKVNLGSNMRQVVFAMIAYSYDSTPPGQAPIWPHDDRMLIAWSGGELTDKIFRSPTHPDIQPAWIYVRPTPTASSSQPVLVSDPRCTDGRGCAVSYADGHVGNVKDPAIWTEAKRLAALPKAAAEGIGASDWTVWLERP